MRAATTPSKKGTSATRGMIESAPISSRRTTKRATRVDEDNDEDDKEEEGDNLKRWPTCHSLISGIVNITGE